MNAQAPLQAPRAAALRQSALLLHAMAPGDRAWLLDRLPEDERGALLSLLEELLAVGIPTDRDLLRDAIARNPLARPEGGEPPPSSDRPGLLRGLDGIVADDRSPAWIRLCALLRQAPAGLVAHLLQMHTWAWSEQAMRTLPPPQRARVNALAEQLQRDAALEAPQATRLREALLHAVAATVLAPTGAPAASSANLDKNAPNGWMRPWRAVIAAP
jgi:hypothetical protein